MKTTLRIDRLVVRTHGLTPAAAEAAARAIAPALAAQLGHPAHAPGSVPILNLEVSAALSPAQIAHAITAQLAAAPRT